MLKGSEFTKQSVLIEVRFSKPLKCISLVAKLRGLCCEGPNSHVASIEAMACSQHYSVNFHFSQEQK